MRSKDELEELLKQRKALQDETLKKIEYYVYGFNDPDGPIPGSVKDLSMQYLATLVKLVDDEETILQTVEDMKAGADREFARLDAFVRGREWHQIIGRITEDAK